MTYDIINIYHELDLPITVTKTEEILAAIDKQIKTWQMRVNNPKFKYEAPYRTSALKRFKTEVIANPGIINRHLAEYQAIADAKYKQTIKDVCEIGRFYVQDGEISPEHLQILVDKFHLDEKSILEVLGVRIRRSKAFIPSTARLIKAKDICAVVDETEVLDCIAMHRVNDCLAKLNGPTTLYDFLGVNCDATSELINGHIDKKERELGNNLRRLDQDVVVSKALLQMCRALLLDCSSRRRYNNSIDVARFEPLEEIIRSLSAVTSYISIQLFKKLLDNAICRGIPKEKGEYFILKTAQSKMLRVDPSILDACQESSKDNSLAITSVLPHSIGARLVHGEIKEPIKNFVIKDTAIPTIQRGVFWAELGERDDIYLELFENSSDSEFVDDDCCKPLFSINLGNSSSSYKTSATVEIVICISEKGVIEYLDVAHVNRYHRLKPQIENMIMLEQMS